VVVVVVVLIGRIRREGVQEVAQECWCLPEIGFWVITRICYRRPQGRLMSRFGFRFGIWMFKRWFLVLCLVAAGD
jgi:hypothetical protein